MSKDLELKGCSNNMANNTFITALSMKIREKTVGLIYALTKKNHNLLIASLSYSSEKRMHDLKEWIFNSVPQQQIFSLRHGKGEKKNLFLIPRKWHASHQFFQ